MKTTLNNVQTKSKNTTYPKQAYKIFAAFIGFIEKPQILKKF